MNVEVEQKDSTGGVVLGQDVLHSSSKGLFNYRTC